MNSKLLGRPALMCSAVLTLAGWSHSQTWGNYQGNIGHTGFSPVQVAPAYFGELWTWQIGLAVPLQQPSAGGGGVFVSNSIGGINRDLTVYAMDVASGTVTWSQTYMGENGLSSLTAPALYNGNLYFQTLNTSESAVLHCFSASTGGVVWEQPFTSQWASFLTPTVDAGEVYIDGGEYGGMYEFDAATGAQYWFNTQIQQYDLWTPALDATLAYAYTGPNSSGTNEAGLYAVNRSNGSLAYHIYDPGFVWNGYTMSESLALSGTMAFATNGNRLVAFDLVGQSVAWQLNRACTGQADVVGNVVYVIDAGTLSAFNATNGAFLWAWAPPLGNIADNIVLTNNVAFVTDLFNTYAIDLSTHQSVWMIAEGGNLAIADGNLYIGGTTGAVTAVSLDALQLSMPTSYQLFRGAAVSGNLTSLIYSDGQVLKVASGPTLNSKEAPVQVILTGTSVVSNPSQLRFHFQGFASLHGLAQTIDLWNFSTGQWVNVSATSSTTTNSVIEASVANPAQYVDSNGQMKARLSWKATGPTLTYQWSASIDQAVWLEG